MPCAIAPAAGRGSTMAMSILQLLEDREVFRFAYANRKTSRSSSSTPLVRRSRLFPNEQLAHRLPALAVRHFHLEERLAVAVRAQVVEPDRAAAVAQVDAD